jgi:N-acetylneuraminic acid mutarotase
VKTKSEISAYVLRGNAAALLFSCVIVALSSAINLPNHPPKLPAPQNNTALGVNAQESAASVVASAIHRNRTLTFADRVAYQRAIEEVYWQHRIWPKTNVGPKPPLDKVMSRAQIEKKVEDYLRNSQALEDYWQRPITPDQLQAEMERIASHTKQPGVLREIFAALGNDPFVIAECLARPALTERLITELNNEDRVKLTRIAWLKEPLGSWLAKAETQMPVTMAAVTANYALPVIASPLGGCTDDTWTPTSLTNAPDGRTEHTAVWTGSEMIIWAGFVPGSGYVNTGGRYNPSTDSWTATSTTNAPDARWSHTVVWTGSEMIVWGGLDTGAIELNTGGKYNPSTNSWTATSTTGAPSARRGHTAVWTGSAMIVWGGFNKTQFELNTGGRYNPGTNSWTATSTTNAPEARNIHTAVWSGSEMIVWGGIDCCNFLNTGGKYNPSADSWTATSTTNAPDARDAHTAVWTGSEMIVWGGFFNDGGTSHFLNTGGRYNPGTNSWIATSTAGAAAARISHTAVWAGSEMIVWGGYNSDFPHFNTGGRYNPSTDSWTATSTTDAPDPRVRHSAVWTGSQMIIWGGDSFGPTYFNTGGRYCAAAPSPTPTPTATATPTPTPTATVTATPTPTLTPTPCAGRCSPTPRPRPTSAGRPTPRPRLTPPPTASPSVTPAPRPTPPPRLTPPPTPTGSPRPTPAPRP